MRCDCDNAVLRQWESSAVEVVYLLVSLAIVLVVLIVAVLLWAVRSKQFDDLEGPAYRILMDDDDP